MNLSKLTSPEWKCGDTFFFTKPDLDNHLHVVLSDPARDPERIVIVNFSSIKPYEKERTCLIEPGEHPLVTIPTFIPYRFAQIVKIDFLEDRHAEGYIARQKPLSSDLLKRALLGASQSLMMPMEAYDIIENQGLVEPF